MEAIRMTCVPTPVLSGFLGLFAFAPPNDVGFFDFLLLNELLLLDFPLVDSLEAAILGIIRRTSL